MTDPITRRQLLAGLAAGAATPLLGLPANAAAADSAGKPSGNLAADVAVIGGGYSGLACARALKAGGRSVILLEARDRVGGRCVNQALPAPYERYVVEGGAEFIGPTQDRMYALARELGIATFTAYNSGLLVDYENGRRTTYSGRIPPGALAGAAEAAVALERLNLMAKQVPLDAPWNAKEARRWDTLTVQAWIDHNVFTDSAKSLLSLATIAVFSAEPRELSFLYFLHYVHAAGDLNYLLDTAGGAQQDRIVGGSQAIALGMAAQIAELIRLRAPVRAITQAADRVHVDGDGFRVTAQRVVVAMSPTMAGRIRYAPLSPAMQARQQLTQRVPMGSIWKVHAIYPTPFWRDAGLNGQVTSDAYLPKVTFDNTPPEPGAPGVMMGFIDGQDARDAVLMTPAARRANVLAAFTTYFGPQAANPVGYLEMNWQAEDYSAGGPTGTFPPGVLTAYRGALRDPVDRIHWAGTETSTIWSGYMDGAVRSGERAAAEILARA
ncbi:MAG: FAD-dependent oxidoreductase [Nevskia sp.]